ncbi:MAG TPA: ANTAR domain-containing protein [Rhodopila sp.]|jgi:response regulator NasT|nr:ANTAR domain-containing protein [Rhodopila sp.]
MKVLIADLDASNGEALAAQLRTQADDFTVTLVGEGEDLLAAVQRAAPDVVIVDMQRPDRDGLDSLQSLNNGKLPPVVMFLDEDLGFMQEAITAGVSTYHGRNAAPSATKLIMRIAMAFFQRTQQVSSRLAEVEERAAAKQTIDAAKLLLMRQDKMSEAAAHRFLQRRAMEQQKRIVDVAAGLLAAGVTKGEHDA